MAVLNYTAAQINTLLAAAAVAPTHAEVTAEISSGVASGISANVGDITQLLTSDKDNCVDAINENFTNADEGKRVIAAALVGKGQSAAASDTWSQLGGKISNLSPQGWVDPSTVLLPKIQNTVTPTGTYATSTYYDTAFGVQLGYAPNGDVLLLMKGGTSTAYEYLRFSLGTVPSGVTITESHNTSSSYATAAAGLIYGCVLHGVPNNCTMAISMSERDSTGDYVTCEISITAV